jgi:DNA (cytosine-5)-methyltransferase 1
MLRVVDVFAGPGGLGEGFSGYRRGTEFELAVSVEMESSAHQTLTLRSFFRKARSDKKALDAYYNYCRSREAVHPSQAAPALWKMAQGEAHQLTLGRPDHNRQLDELLDSANLSAESTVLIGGPPCQAYSLVGRARNKGKVGYVAEADHRHFLYREYLRILKKVRPAVFVMENVKGILSSRVGGRRVFHDILCDLVEPGKAVSGKSDGLKYKIHSLSVPCSFEAGMDPNEVEPTSFVVHAENYGIPQARHRVILLGVRSDIEYDGEHVLSPTDHVTLAEALSDLPPLRSRLSRGDSYPEWQRTVLDHATSLCADATRKNLDWLALRLRCEALKVSAARETGGVRVPREISSSLYFDPYHQWVSDPTLDVWLNHESRSHMPSDLARYYFAASFALAMHRSPKGHQDFSLEGLAPAHANWKSGKFPDRFRVQLIGEPSTTITSHIAKDGHYFIHPAAWQCRSLTVREAARLQTFPDNYFFQGNRTQQYHQVGNAVPSLLASQIAAVVSKILRGREGFNRENEADLTRVKSIKTGT